jgi:lantibiotic modifying enzyme
MQNLDDDYDYSLCHGLAGLSELFLLANHILSDNTHESLIESIAHNGIKKHGKDLSWKCGIGSDHPPGMMLGLSGIGYFYLRLYDYKKIPSILLITKKLEINGYS